MFASSTVCRDSTREVVVQMSAQPRFVRMHLVSCATMSSARSTWFVEPGGQRYFEQSSPLLSLSPPWRRPGLRRPDESHTTSVGSRIESDSPGASTEARPGNGRRSTKQVAELNMLRPAGRGLLVVPFLWGCLAVRGRRR